MLKREKCFSRFFFFLSSFFLPLNLNLGNEDLIVVVPGSTRDLGNSGLRAQGHLRTDIYQKQIHIEPVHSHTH